MIVAEIIDRPLTVSDLKDLPDDGKRYELIWGELYMSPAPEIRHQIAVMNLAEIFISALTQQGRGMVFSSPLDIQFDDNNMVQPDLIVVAVENRAAVQGPVFSGVPDLVVEVLSPSTRRRDFVMKSVLYARNQVSEYWIVDPTTLRIRVYSLEGEAFVEQTSSDGVARSVRFPGVEADPAVVFALPEAMRS